MLILKTFQMVLKRLNNRMHINYNISFMDYPDKIMSSTASVVPQ